MKYKIPLKNTFSVHKNLRFILVLAMLWIPNLVLAHDIPSRVTVYAFVKPEGNELTALLRVPMEAFGEVSFPLRGPGFLQFSEAQFELNDAARIYITESMHFFENGVELTEKESDIIVSLLNSMGRGITKEAVMSKVWMLNSKMETHA